VKLHLQLKLLQPLHVNVPGAAAPWRMVVQHCAGCSMMLQGCGTFEEGYEHLAVLKDM
jgi:hypothetical protein